MHTTTCADAHDEDIHSKSAYEAGQGSARKNASQIDDVQQSNAASTSSVTLYDTLRTVKAAPGVFQPTGVNKPVSPNTPDDGVSPSDESQTHGKASRYAKQGMKSINSFDAPVKYSKQASRAGVSDEDEKEHEHFKGHADKKTPKITQLSSVRISWIDIARGIGLALIVLADVTSYFTDQPWAAGVLGFCGAFAFPLLFMMCGYTTNRDDFSARRIASLAHRYLVPYLAGAVIVTVISCAISGKWDILGWVASFIYADGGVRGVLLGADVLTNIHDIGILWILPALFIARVAAHILAYIPMITRLLISGAIFIVCAATSGDVYLPFSLQPAGCALWFMTCGMIFREQALFSRNGWERIMIALGATLGVAYIVVLTGNWMTAPEYNVAFFHQAPIDMFGGVCAAIVFMVLSQILGELTGVLDNVLEWVGRNIVPLYCWHAVTLSLVPVAMGAVTATGLASLPVGAVFAIVLLCAYVSATLLALISYKLPFLHWVFCPSTSSSDALVKEAQMNKEQMTLINESEVE